MSALIARFVASTTKLSTMLPKKSVYVFTSHELFAGNQQAWYPINPAKAETCLKIKGCEMKCLEINCLIPLIKDITLTTAD